MIKKNEFLSYLVKNRSNFSLKINSFLQFFIRYCAGYTEISRFWVAASYMWVAASYIWVAASCIWVVARYIWVAPSYI